MLLAEGVNPALPLVMFTSDGTPSLSSTIGRAASLTVHENDSGGPKIVKYRRPTFSLAIPPAPEVAKFEGRLGRAH